MLSEFDKSGELVNYHMYRYSIKRKGHGRGSSDSPKGGRGVLPPPLYSGPIFFNVVIVMH